MMASMGTGPVKSSTAEAPAVIDLAETRLRYDRSRLPARLPQRGTGPVLLLVHGIGDSLRAGCR